jgi:hypothetical protein
MGQIWQGSPAMGEVPERLRTTKENIGPRTRRKAGFLFVHCYNSSFNALAQYSASSFRHSRKRNSNMRMSPQEAISLLRKFVEERTLLKAVFSSRFGPVSAAVVGRLFGTPKEGIMVKSDNGEDMVCFSISECIYDYSEGREARPEFRESAEDRFEGALTIIFPRPDVLNCHENLMERIHIMELKNKS